VKAGTFFTDKKLFTTAALQTHKMICLLHTPVAAKKSNITTNIVFYEHIPLAAVLLAVSTLGCVCLVMVAPLYFHPVVSSSFFFFLFYFLA